MINKPFLKWAGGKTRLIERIRTVLPEGNRFIEPFAGSAVIFLNTNYKKNIIADSNEDLINLYLYLKKDGKKFIDYAKKLFKPENNCESNYINLRSQFNTTKNLRLKSALFIYLNKHGFNGLCRYNSKNIFNVPFGLYPKPPAFPEKEMLYFHQKAQNAVFLYADFKKIFELAKPGDVIYCDPPYIPLSKTSNFTSYGAFKFGLKEQEELAELAHKYSKVGAKIIISNHHTEYARKIYARAKITSFDVQRFISSIGTKRTKATELLASFG
jgi:DNA adenine methylase